MTLLAVMLVGISWFLVRAGGTQSEAQPVWVMSVRSYPTEDKSEWDAYLLNVRTGELFMVTQGTMIRVKAGEGERRHPSPINSEATPAATGY